jgi:catechol 2,3-dioxygenase-like lactoylglutathione lyase family enzyme
MPAPNALGLVATDLPRTLAFYRALGLDIPADADAAPHVGVDLGSGFMLMIDPLSTIQAFDPDWKAPTGSPRTSLAFQCASPTEVDATYRAMTDAGWHGHKEPWDAFWGQRYAVLRDPDGNGVDLYCELPEPAAS